MNFWRKKIGIILLLIAISIINIHAIIPHHHHHELDENSICLSHEHSQEIDHSCDQSHENACCVLVKNITKLNISLDFNLYANKALFVSSYSNFNPVIIKDLIKYSHHTLNLNLLRGPPQ